MRDLKNSIAVAQTIAPALYDATETGAGVDLQGFNSATVLVDVGAWTDGAHAFEVQESDDDVTYTAVAADDLLGTEPTVDGADDDAAVFRIGYVGYRRYLRVVATVTGSPTTGAVYGAHVVLGHPLNAPTA